MGATLSGVGTETLIMIQETQITFDTLGYDNKIILFSVIGRQFYSMYYKLL